MDDTSSVAAGEEAHDHQRLAALTGAPDPAIDEVVEVRLRGRRPKSWRKWPDLPLGRHVELRRQA